MSALPDRTVAYLQNGAQKGNRNEELLQAACQFRDAGCTEAEAIRELTARATADGLSGHAANATIRSAFSRPPREQIRATGQWNRAEKDQTACHYRRIATKPMPLPKPMQESAIAFLETVFRQGEFVGISEAIERRDNDGISVGPNGGWVRTIETWIADIRLRGMDAVFKSNDGLFVRVNPLRDANGKTDKDVAAYRYALVESDEGTKEQQLAAFHAIGLPISVCTDSGNRSLHALVNVDAPDESAYRERFEILREYCDQALGLKVDRKNKNPSRFTRMPGAKRARRDDDDNLVLDQSGQRILDQQTLLERNLPGKPWDEWLASLPIEQPAPLIEFLKPSQIKAYEPPPGTLLVGDNHIVRGGVFVIGGPPGVGKSRTAVGLAEAGATKLDWLGCKVHCSFRTLIIQSENGRFRLQMEFAELNHELLDNFLRISPPPPLGLRFDKFDFRDQVKAYIETWEPGVVIIDPLNAVAKDDKQKDYRETFDLIREVVPAGDDAPAIGILAHTRKPLPNERTNGRSLLNLLAGSHVLASIPRSIWIEQHASDEVNETRVVVTCCKNNDGELGNRSVWTRDNGLWTSVHDFDWTAWDNGEKEQDFTAENVVEILVRNSKGLSQSKLASEIKKRGVSQATAYRRIERAEKTGLIKFQKGKDVYVIP